MACLKSQWVASPRRFGQYLGWAALLLLLCCDGASALSSDGTLRDLKHTAWGQKEGSPDAIVSVVQTSDGYLWLANPSGLYRFDGLRFEHIDLPRGDRPMSSNVSTIFAPASGGLWIGFSFGGAAFLKDGRLAPYTVRDGLPEGAVRAIAQDSAGIVWAGTREGLARLEGSRWHKVGPKEHFSDARATALMVDSAGTLWTSSDSKTLFLPKGESLFRETAERSENPINAAIGIAELPSGEVWVVRTNAMHRVFKNDNPMRLPATSGTQLLADKAGTLWTMGNEASIQRIPHPEALPSSVRITAIDPPDVFSEADGRIPVTGAIPMLEDREGNVWTTSGVGLERFSERNVALAPPFKNDENTDFGYYVADIASANQGPLWVTGLQFELFTDSSDKPGTRDEVGWLTSRLRAADGSVWLGSNNGIWHFAEGRLQRTALPEGSRNQTVQAMAEDGAGGIWVSLLGRGVFRVANGQWTPRGDIAALPTLTPLTASRDAKGRVWFGYTEGRIAVLEGSSVKFFTDDSRSPVGAVTALYGKRKLVWAGGEFGLALFDGTRFQQVTLESGTEITGVTGIVETADGDVWVNCGAGIAHFPAAQVRRAADGSSYRLQGEVFDVLDGVEGSSTTLRPLPTAIESGDGKLWFARQVKIYSVDPTRLFRNALPPQVLVQALHVDGTNYVPAGEMELPKGTTSLRIDYVAPNLTLAEKVRYRYQLDGVDNGWQDVGGRRQAFYTNLRPGKYKFRVLAANNDGVWNESGAALDFSITPTFVQTGWFIALCIVGAGTVLGLLIRLRFRQVSARMQMRYEERMAERERIARELHDTLLQGTQGLILTVQAAAKRVPAEQPAHGMLLEALDRADEVVAEGRDRIQDLRIPTELQGDLGTSLAAMGDELARGGSVQFRTTVDGPTGTLVPGARDAAYRIGREAIFNAFRHAQAGMIEVQLIFSVDDFRLRVRDDGLGIDEKAFEAGALPGHWGLPGMRERAGKIGATLDMWSRPGAGTEIELRIPANKAYPGRVARPGWLAFGRPA